MVIVWLGGNIGISLMPQHSEPGTWCLDENNLSNVGVREHPVSMYQETAEVLLIEVSHKIGSVVFFSKFARQLMMVGFALAIHMSYAYRYAVPHRESI